MKLSWKLFFLTTPVFMLFFTVFGAWMIQGSFQSGVEQETARCLTENQMFQNSYELTRHGLSAAQLAQTDVQEIVESFYDSDGRKNESMRIYDGDGKILYESGGMRAVHSIRELLTREHNTGYELVQQQNKTYLVVMCLDSFGQYIETTADISRLFEERSSMYARYQTGMLAVSLIAGLLIFLVIFSVVRKVQTLSYTVQRFAGGQYEIRSKVKSSDEVGALSRDFNRMADVMCGQMERLQGEVERQEEFTSAFAHELKTPLTSIIGYADTLRQMELSREETDMCANYIYHQGKRLQSLSYKLLEMLMVGKQEIVKKEIDAENFLKEVGDTVKPSLRQKGIALEIQAEQGRICGDADLLSTVFINFLDNAGKASKEGQRVRLNGYAGEYGYCIAVEDEGRGIPPEALGKITEAFYMVDKSRARKEGGAGLGLALCRKILALHGAQWEIASEPGKGTTMTVRFQKESLPKRERRKRRRKER